MVLSFEKTTCLLGADSSGEFNLSMNYCEKLSSTKTCISPNEILTLLSSNSYDLT